MRFHLDLGRWNQTDRISGGATLVLFISFFLPWFGVNLYGATYSENGLDVDGYLYIPLLVSLATVLYLIACAGWRATSRQDAVRPQSHVVRGHNCRRCPGLYCVLAEAIGTWLGGRRILALIAGVVAVLPFAVPIYLGT